MREFGIEEAVDTSLAAFRVEMPARLDALEQASDLNDAQAIATAAHSMKSAAGAIHAAVLAETLDSLEMTAKAGDAEAARRLVNEAHSQLSDVMLYLQKQDRGIL